MGPAKPKEGPMACEPKDVQSFTTSLQDRKTECLQILLSFNTSAETEWLQAGDERKQGPKTDKDRGSLPLAKQVVKTKRGGFVFPPAYTRLSDELVYLATKFVKGKERGEKYPYDFDPKGDINANRIPSGVGPIVWAHGLPFFPVYKGYYILTGRAHASDIGWKLYEKSTAKFKYWPTWAIGPVVAPPSAVRLERTIDRQLLVYKAENANDFEKGSEKAIAARDVVSSLHTHGSVFPMENGFIVAPLHRFKGYHVRVGPEKTGVRVGDIGPAFFKENDIHGDYYEVASKVPYSNETRTGVKDGGLLVGNAHYLNEAEDHEMEDADQGDQEDNGSEEDGPDDHDEDEGDHGKTKEKAPLAAEKEVPKTGPKSPSNASDVYEPALESTSDQASEKPSDVREPIPESTSDQVSEKNGDEKIPETIGRDVSGDEAKDYDNSEASGPETSIDQAQGTSGTVNETKIKDGPMDAVTKSNTINDDTAPPDKARELDEKMVEG